MITIIEANWPEQAPLVTTILRAYGEYLAGLGFLASRVAIEAEIAALPGEYAPPGGGFLLALAEATDSPAIAGGVGYKTQTPGICELKRLYVRPEFRGVGLGRRLTQAVIDRARARGDTRLRLDTSPRLAEALALYRALGFVAIPPYGPVVYGDPLFMELRLD